MRPSSMRQPSGPGWNERSGIRIRKLGMRLAGQRRRSGVASWGNISGNKGMGTSVSMVIPSSGSERAESRRAGKRPSRSVPLPRRRRQEGQETSCAVFLIGKQIYEPLDETSEILHGRQRHFSTPLISSKDLPRDRTGNFRRTGLFLHTRLRATRRIRLARFVEKRRESREKQAS